MPAARVVFAATLLLIVAASCTVSRPGIGLRIAGTDVPPSREISFCQSGGCRGECGDGMAPALPATPVRATSPLRFEFATGNEVTKIHGDIWAGPSMRTSALETFELAGGGRAYTTQRVTTGDYYIAVTIQWSRPFDRGDSSFAFHIDVRP